MIIKSKSDVEILFSQWWVIHLGLDERDPQAKTSFPIFKAGWCGEERDPIDTYGAYDAGRLYMRSWARVNK